MKHSDIESYLNGDLQGEALEQFQQAMEQNPAIQEEVARLKPVWHMLRRAGIAQKVENAMASYERKKRLRRLVFVVIASLVVLAVLLLGWKRFISYQQKSEQNPSFKEETPTQQPSIPTVQQQDKLNQKEITASHSLESRVDQRVQALAVQFYRRNPAERMYTSSSERSGQDTSQHITRMLSVSEKALKQAADLFEETKYKQAKLAFLKLSTQYPIYKDDGEWYALLSALAETPADTQTAGKLSRQIMMDPNQHTYLKETELLISELKRLNKTL